MLNQPFSSCSHHHLTYSFRPTSSPIPITSHMPVNTLVFTAAPQKGDWRCRRKINSSKAIMKTACKTLRPMHSFELSLFPNHFPQKTRLRLAHITSIPLGVLATTVNINENDVTAKTGAWGCKYIIHKWREALGKEQNTIIRKSLKCAILPELVKSARS